MEASATAPAGDAATAASPATAAAPSPPIAPPTPSPVSTAPPPVTISPPTPAPTFLPDASATPIREDQVQNAVSFLSHPQVRGSTNTASKRSFLERKGLTAAEIDEAFRRVPEAPAPTPAPAAPAAQPVTYLPQPSAAQGQQQLAVMPQQPYPTNAPQLVAAQSAPAVMQAPPSLRWSQVVLGVGVVAAAGWAVQQFVVPRLRSLVGSWQASRREAEEARDKALAAALDSLKGCQEELKASTQALAEAVSLMREQQRAGSVDGITATRGTAPPGRYGISSSRYDAPYTGVVGGSSNTASILPPDNYAAIRAAAGYTNSYPPEPVSYGYGRESGPAAGPTGGDGRGGSTASGAPVYGMPTQQQPFGGIRSAANGPYGGQAQESLPYKVTAPPSPAHSTHSLQSGGRQQQPSQSGAYVGGMGGQYGSSDRLYDASLPGPASPAKVLDGPGASSGAGATPGSRTVPRPPPDQPAYPPSFHEVMEMVQKGITPPNVRTDINDTPPDPTRPLSEARLSAPAKPWEQNSGSQAAAPSYGYSPANTASNPLYGTSATSVTSVGGSSSAPYGVGVGSTGPVYGAGGSASGSSSLSVLPPLNPAWRPPPPPTRTVPVAAPSSTAASSGPSSPPSGSASGMAPSGSAPAPVPVPVSVAGGGAAALGPYGGAPQAPLRAVSEPPPPPLPLPPAGVVAGPGANLTLNAAPAGGAAGVAAGADMAPQSPTPSQPAFAPSGGEAAAREAFVDGPAVQVGAAGQGLIEAAAGTEGPADAAAAGVFAAGGDDI